jgi:hypothetical protein
MLSLWWLAVFGLFGLVGLTCWWFPKESSMPTVGSAILVIAIASLPFWL